jgi:hypothetical protein
MLSIEGLGDKRKSKAFAGALPQSYQVVLFGAHRTAQEAT